MACHEKSFSSYQREAIDRVKALIGDTPFEYEKSANNHLRVKISGIDRMFFTGSTPSDTRSIDNFIGDIRSEMNRIKVLNSKQSIPTEPPKSLIKANERKSAQNFINDITQSINKKIKYEIEHIKKEEEKMLTTLESCNDDLGQNIRDFRKNLIKNEIEQKMASKGKLFIPPGLVKQCHGQIDEYLGNMLPKIPEYQSKLLEKVYLHSLSSQEEEGIKENGSEEKQQLNLKVTISEVAKSIKPQEKTQQEKEIPKPNASVEIVPANIKQKAKMASPEIEPLESSQNQSEAGQDTLNTVLTSLVNAKSNKRVAMIKTLPKQKIIALIEDFKRALTQKHQDDINFLAEQMQSRGISLDELEAALSK
ncbi:hypothetical protein [uncultured Acinetobacter sp.]|uniref:hypothetical protein n=1 Tax=uncultured Acinetobacter sp. TaxID=165433 RepID=UPI00261E4900|nr:hypothetical protein [uncultured Acinetobacter sp.]